MQQESSPEDRRGGAVLGKVLRVQTQMCSEERGKIGLRGKVHLCYGAKDCRLT